VFRLTAQQRTFYEAFGFLRLAGLFRDEADQLSQGFDSVFAQHEPTMVITSEDDVLQRTERAAGRSYRNIIAPDFVDRSPLLRGLPRHPRVTGVVESLLDGQPYEYRASDGHRFHCDTSWHYDAYGTPLDRYTVKLSFYLDPLRADSGAIRVIPGTHEHGSAFSKTLQETLYRSPDGIRELYGVEAEAIPAWTLENEPGDVLVWSFRTIHASFHGREGRRSFALAFSTLGGASADRARPEA
jgi:hypothetical protein